MSKADINPSYLIASILSVPIFIYGFASMLNIATVFCQDTWSGSTLYKQLTGVSTIVMESICALVFLGIPLMTMVVALFLNSDYWWEITAWVWVGCVVAMLVVFGFCVVMREVQACQELLPMMYPELQSKPFARFKQTNG